ncbi:hypothetical protein PQR34_34590 [Paraburkholderia sediminicola]|uniref:hypothetical protein n=1 Tax=Paraburkholderia sediminicola TaxID=458836 RepID=UPI0038B7FBAC
MVVFEIALALVAGAIALSLVFVGAVWVLKAIVGLAQAVVRAPFNREARVNLVALRFLRHPFFIVGMRTPTARMQALARQVAQERRLVLPATTLRSFYRTCGS